MKIEEILSFHEHLFP